MSDSPFAPCILRGAFLPLRWTAKTSTFRAGKISLSLSLSLSRFFFSFSSSFSFFSFFFIYLNEDTGNSRWVYTAGSFIKSPVSPYLHQFSITLNLRFSAYGK